MGKTNNPTGIGGFKPGQSGNPSGVSKNGLGNRPYRAALRMEAAIAEHGGRPPHVNKRSLRYLARQALERAAHNTAALEHIANRLDGPVIPAPDELPNQSIVEIQLVIVEPRQIEHSPVDAMKLCPKCKQLRCICGTMPTSPSLTSDNAETKQC